MFSLISVTKIKFVNDTLVIARHSKRLFLGFEKALFLEHQSVSIIFILSFLFFAPVLYAMDGKDGFEDQKEVVKELVIETPYVVNMHYEYDDTDINNLLLLRAQETGLDLDRTVLMPPLDNMGNQFVEQLLEESTRYSNRVLAHEIEPFARTILLPVSLNSIHWVGIVVRLDERNMVVQVQYIDPLGGCVSEDYVPKEIRGFLRDVYGDKIRIECLTLLRQTDRSSSGVLTVENLIRVAQNRFDTEVVSEELTREMRKHHISLLQKFKPNLQLNAMKGSGVCKRRIQKEIEHSFSVIFNEMLFYRFLRGRLIFLYGTSTAGKTSIVNYIKDKAQLKNVNLVVTGTDAVSYLHHLYAYSCYSPEKVRFLRHYFSAEEILRGIYDYHLNFELINKRGITEKRARCIQSIFDELRANKEEIQNRFLSRSGRPRFCALSFMDALALGKTIIVDTVNPDGFFRAMAVSMALCDVDIVMVYCPPKQLLDRLYYRNAGALKSGSTDNCRPGAFPLKQFTEIYEPTIFPNQAIDNLDLSDIRIPERLSEVCKSVYEYDGCLHLYRENQWSDVESLMKKNFGINSAEDRVFIKPRYGYHFFVHTGKEKTAVCAKRVLKSLRILERCSGMARNDMPLSEPASLVVPTINDSAVSSSDNSSAEDAESTSLSSSASQNLSGAPAPLLSATDVTEDTSNETPVVQECFTESRIEKGMANIIDDSTFQNIYKIFIKQLMDLLRTALSGTDSVAIVERLNELERQVRESDLDSALRKELADRISAIKSLISQEEAVHAIVLVDHNIDQDAAMDPDQLEMIFGEFIRRDPSEVLPHIVEGDYIDVVGGATSKTKQASNSASEGNRSVNVVGFGVDLPVLLTLDKGKTLNFNFFEQERTGALFANQIKHIIGSIFDVVSYAGVLRGDRAALI